MFSIGNSFLAKIKWSSVKYLYFHCDNHGLSLSQVPETGYAMFEI